MVQGNLGVLDVSHVPTPRPGDTFILENKAERAAKPLLRSLGQIIYVSEHDDQAVAEIVPSEMVQPGADVIVGIPEQVIYQKDTGIPLAIRMRVGATGKVQSLATNSALVTIQLQPSGAGQHIFRGDRVYLGELPGFSVWFVPPDDDLIEYLLYERDYERALRFYRKRRYTEAIEALQGHLKQNPSPLEEVRLLARCYQGLGDYPQAVTYYEQYVAARPSEVEPQIQLAYLHLRWGETTKALQRFE
ncbi:MAG: hypothetical protein D6736_18780, partial [Nitrospinota bacterium]